MSLAMVQQVIDNGLTFWEQVAVGVTAGVILAAIGVIIKHVRRK